MRIALVAVVALLACDKDRPAPPDHGAQVRAEAAALYQAMADRDHWEVTFAASGPAQATLRINWPDCTAAEVEQLVAAAGDLRRVAVKLGFHAVECDDGATVHRVGLR
jgi:hypothetical protein